MASLPQSRPRVAIYARSATLSQETGDAPLVRQERLCRAYAAEHGYTIVPDHVYHEVGPGSARASHLALTAAIAAVRQREVAAIRVAGPDRISRDPAWLARVEREVQQAGGRIEYVEDPRWL